LDPDEANKRIYATTDRAKGTLKQLADAQGWPTFVVPDDVGGRYSFQRFNVKILTGILDIESYKKNMFALLGKPGYEDRKAELEAKLG